MIYFIIVLIIAIILSIQAWMDEGFLCGFGIFLTSFLIGSLISMLLSLFIGTFFMSHNVGEITSVKNIVSLKDNIDIEGKGGFLRGTTIENELYYYYMVETENGYSFEKIEANNTYIKYSNDNFRIETKSYLTFDNPVLYWFALPVKNSETIIYIPEGSIIYDYEIDLE
jgi:hypothetical protein